MAEMILSSGLRLAFEHYGDPQGTPAFYFHGWPSSRLQGELMDGAGKRLGLHVVAMDRPGIGRSDYQPGRQLLDWPPLLQELARHLGWEKFHVFGVSGGGPYALVTAYALPEQVLSASVICGAPPLRLLGVQDMFWPYRAVLALRQRVPWLLTPVFSVGAMVSRLRPDQWPLKWAIGMLNARDREVLGNLDTHRMMMGGFRESLCSGVASVQADGDIYLSDWGFDLEDIRVPVHFWHGKADRNIPWTYARQVAAKVPCAIPHWAEQEGHYSLPVLRTEEITRVALGLPCPAN
jgi:pimeloyl-ACP methyl ester carboxylesterase